MMQREGNLAAEGAIHVFLDYFGRIIVAEEEHQFGECGFGGTVVPAYYAGIFEFAARAVSVHLHGSSHTLTYVDDDNSFVNSLFEQVEKPLFYRRVARAEGFQYDSFQSRDIQNRAYGLLRYTGE